MKLLLFAVAVAFLVIGIILGHSLCLIGAPEGILPLEDCISATNYAAEMHANVKSYMLLNPSYRSSFNKIYGDIEAQERWYQIHKSAVWYMERLK